MNLKLKIAACLSFAMVLWVPEGLADTQQTARPGTLNYVEGEATVGTQTLDAKSVGKVEVAPGHSLKTSAGKAEILLTPGVFLRLGDQSSARMISSGLLDTEVAIERGQATVEVDEMHKENNLRIVEDGKTTDLIKTGLYDFDADRQLVRVLDGKAFVEDGDRRIKVKRGHEVDLAGSEPLRATKFDKQVTEEGDLYRWTSLRSSYLAEANADAAQMYFGGGYGWFGDGWYWDPWFDAFTFLPGDGIFYSPFGWGFYSPGFAFAAPFFYGRPYYHHFGVNYHAWGPGPHYGLPSNYGHGVHYGARSSFGGGGYSGRMMSPVFGGGFGGGGFHSGGGFGGFHGGGGMGGGFHGGGMGGGHH
jgi:hypothetical protein